MKSPAKILIIPFALLLSLNSSGQNDKIVLRPQTGKEYIYEFTESKYFQTASRKSLTDYIKKKILKIKCVNMQPENRELLLVSVIENTAEKPESDPVQFKDYRYPEFKDGFYENRYDNYWEELLPWIDFFQYEFDMETMEIKLHNREDVLSEIRSLLRRKGFDDKAVEWHTTNFDTIGIAQISRHVRSIFKISKNTFQDEIIEPSEFDEIHDSKNSIISVNQKKLKKTPGLYSRYFSYDKNESLLKEYKIIEIDSSKFARWIFGEPLHIYFKENSISLRSVKSIQENRLFLSGYVENLKNKKVTVGILRDPFGTKLYEKTVHLDDNNLFQLEMEFKHAGLVYVQFEKNYRENKLQNLALYAEPGNHIYFEAKGDSFPWTINFSGDNSQVSKMIYDFGKEYNLFFIRSSFHSFSWFLNRGKYDELEEGLKNSDSFFRKYKNSMPQYIYNYVTTELKAYLYIGVLYYLNLRKVADNYPFGRPYFPEGEKVDFKYFEGLVDNLQLHCNYNDYGIQSRQLAADLLNYHFKKVKKINNLRNLDYSHVIITSDIRTFGDLPNKVEITKTILAGHALYSTLAEFLLTERMNTLNYGSKDERYIQNEITKYFDLMLRLVNNREFANAIEILLENHLRWQKMDYIPRTKFLNPKGEQVCFSDFIGKKPSVFYITQQWERERYFWDDLAKENPEINFVLVTEGSSFSEWKDYTRRADPIAHQLFLLNDNRNLRGIFKNDNYHFIAYDKNGVRIDFAEDPINAMNLAKHSLMIQEEREPDRSTLITIIVILGILLFVGSLAFFIWRWRNSRLFRKEQQQRRLRELELTAIRSQMNPHFLFNCLNSVQNLVRKKMNREAHLYLADFAGLIRKVLQNSEKEEVSLAEELEMVQQYLNLEELRFDFDFNISVDESIDTNNTMVPSMLLQPFAENAIIHGLQTKPGNKELKIEVCKATAIYSEKHITFTGSLNHKSHTDMSAQNILYQKNHNEISNTKLTDKHLAKPEIQGILISVEDNGIGREAAKNMGSAKNGKSSKLLKERLEILSQKQKDKYHLEIIDIKNNEATGTRVEIFIPEEK